MYPSALRVCSAPGGQKPVLSLSLDLIANQQLLIFTCSVKILRCYQNVNVRILMWWIKQDTVFYLNNSNTFACFIIFLFLELRIELSRQKTTTVSKCQIILKSFQTCTAHKVKPCNHSWIFYTPLSWQSKSMSGLIQLNKVFTIGIRSLSMHPYVWNILMSMHLKSHVNASCSEILFRPGLQPDTSVSPNKPPWTLPVIVDEMLSST